MPSRTSPPGIFGPIRQLGYVVRDLDSAIDRWSRQLGVGPWLVIRNVPLHCVYRGQPSQPHIDLGLSYRGDVQIELIQQTNSAPSPYRPFIERGHYGLHHSAFLSEDIGADVAAAQTAGLQLLCDINMPAGGRYVYFESPVPGEQTVIEFLEATPEMRQMFAQGIASAASWDGAAAPTVIDFAALHAR